MEPKKISPEQICALFKFIRKKWVPYYDVQVELVDHFATAIEEMWIQNPKLSFEHAIQKVYATFPLTGFYALVEKQKQAVQKEAWRWVCKVWKSYFRWPRILMSICIFLAVRTIFFLPINAFLLFGGLCGVLLILSLWKFYQLKKMPKRLNQRFLRIETTLESIKFIIFQANPLLYLWYSLLEFGAIALPTWACWVMAFYLTYFGFLLYIVCFQLPKRAENDLYRHFPQYA